MPTPTTWVRVGGKDVALRRIPHNTDLVIVEQAIKNVETYPLLARKSLHGPSVAMWGHGRSYSTPQGPALAAAKQFLTRRCDWFFAYTQGGADHVIAHGFPAARVSVLNNTIDTAALRRDLDSVSDDDVAAFSRHQGLTPGRTALFLGGVDSAKGIDFLLESAVEAEKRLPGFMLLVGGAGDQLDDVGQAQRAGAPIRALGRLDGHAKALALRAADVMAIPSSVGLVAVDSLVAGVPIATRANGTHGPEADYLTPEIAVWLAATTDSAEYALAITDLLADTMRLAEMRSRCRAEAARYGLDHMVDAFVEGVLAWEDVVRAGL
jgi:glycosyltransferase involved in cell wall biosynthesis